MQLFSSTNHDIHLITARDGDRMNGQIATWIMPATLAPERGRLVVVLSPMNHTHSLIEATGRFAVQMLAAEQHALLPRFGLHSGRDVDKFAGMDLAFTPLGLPLLPDGCGWAECVVVAVVDTGDRRVCIADVTAEGGGSGTQPLRKAEAFALQLPDVRAQLLEKARQDGIRSSTLWKPLEPRVPASR